MLTTSQSYVTYQGNGSTTVFPYGFLVQQASHMVVSITNNNVNWPSTTVLNASQYGVTGIGNANGGNVTYSTLAAGWSITIQRIVPYQQNTVLTNQGAFYPAVVEAALDYLTMEVQQINAAQSTSVLIGPAGANGNTILSGATDPAGGTGVLGDFYINATSLKIFGPKGGGGWPTGVSIAGANGNTIWSGAGAPGGGTGINGDFYINTSTSTLYGPKAAGAWPGGVSLVGPGVPGPAGPMGPAGSGTGIGKNRIINGQMKFDLRHNGASQTVGTADSGDTIFKVDRWGVTATGANITAQQVPGSGVWKNFLQLTGAANNTGFTVFQRLESVNVFDLVSQTVTFSAFVSSTSLTNLTWSVYYANATDNFSATTLIATGAWTINSGLAQYSAQISLPANAANGVAVVLSGGALLASQTFIVTGCQLEPGGVATSLEMIPYDLEFLRCQRYLPGYRGILGLAGINAMGQANTATTATVILPFFVPPRAKPTGIVYGPGGADFYLLKNDGVSGLAVSNINFGGATYASYANSVSLSMTCTSGLTAGQATWLSSDAASYIYFTGCEL